MGWKRDGLGTQDLSLCKNRTSRHGMDNSSAHSAGRSISWTGIRTFLGAALENGNHQQNLASRITFSPNFSKELLDYNSEVH